MKSQIKRTIAILLLVCFLASLTASTVIAQSVVDLGKLGYVAAFSEYHNKYPDYAYLNTRVVEEALYNEGFLAKKYIDYNYGSETIKAYQKWQRSIGSQERYCNGVAGPKDLAKLGKRYGFIGIP